MPFFIEWEPGTHLPGRAPTDHAAGEVRIGEVRVSGDSERIEGWLGSYRVPLDIRPGSSALTAVILSPPSGDEVVLGATEH